MTNKTTAKNRFEKQFPLGGETWVLKRHMESVWDFISQEIDKAYAKGYKDGFGKDCENGAKQYLEEKKIRAERDKEWEKRIREQMNTKEEIELSKEISKEAGMILEQQNVILEGLLNNKEEK